MSERTILTLAAVATSSLLAAQEMVLGSGTLTVAEGTALRMEGPVTFTISTGAVVQNNGTIDLGSEAVLAEPLNWPIVGTGREVADLDAIAPFAGLEPGGLGLTLSTASGIAPLSVERWHSVLTLPGGEASIARWYQFTGNDQGPGSLDLSFRYDPTELNGLSAADLAMFTISTENSPWWNDLASAADAGAFTVTANHSAPWAVVALFDSDAPTTISDRSEVDGFRAWPTEVRSSMIVAHTAGTLIRTLEVFDGAGRRVPFRADVPNTWVSMAMESLAPGAYFLRINGVSVIKFRKA